MLSRSANAALDQVPFARLAQLGLPPRVRSLIEGVHHVAVPIVNSGLERALDDLERDLLAHVDRTLRDDEQASCLASLRELKKQRADFVHACNLAIQRSLLALVGKGAAPDPTADDSPHASDSVSHRDELITLAQIAARAEIRAAAGLNGLAYRLAVIAGTPPIELDALALGPQQLCAAINFGARSLALAPMHRMSLFRRIDKCLFGEAGVLYEAINRYLIEHRVFAHLQTAPRASQPPEASPAVVELPLPSAPPAPITEAPAEPKAELTAETPASPPPAEAVSTPAAEVPGPVASPVRMRERTAAERGAPDAPLDLHFFRALRDAIAARRRAHAGPESAAERERPVADKADVLTALGVLQSQSPTPVMIGGKWANRGVAHIRQDLLNLLRARHGGITPRLRDEDTDSIELVGLLFDRLLAAWPGNSNRHALLSRLQVPILRVVLKDPGFFPRRTHPARQLLESVCGLLAHWIEDEDADRATLDRVQAVIDRLLKEYAEQLVAFERGQEELDRILGALQKKAEIAERRHVEAARGREKLDLAQAAAEEVVRERLSAQRVPHALRALLEHAWTDTLALALLRQGVDHPVTRERLELVDSLLRAFAAGPGSARLALEPLRSVFEDGLAAIGFHEDAIAAAWEEVCRLATSPDSDDRATRSLSALLQQRPRLGGETRIAGEGSGESWLVETQAVATPELAAAAERIAQLPPGTWLEFVHKPPAPAVRRRLCWFSTLTGRTVLLSPRGGKDDERSLAQLARELALGQLRVVPDAQSHLVDSAWREVMAMHRASPILGAAGSPA